eukprot:SAG31_NODE_6125_length_2158_cov_1.239437_2_plen_49_part_00
MMTNMSIQLKNKERVTNPSCSVSTLRIREHFRALQTLKVQALFVGVEQ